MYTKKKLESDTFHRLYNHIGKIESNKIKKIENILDENINNNLNIKYDDVNLISNEKIIKLVHFIKLKKENEYIKSTIIKERKKEPLDISLELIESGFDYTTGERYERKKGEVSYFYQNNKVLINQIKDEDYLNKLEEEKKEKIKKIVLKFKKDLSV